MTTTTPRHRKAAARRLEEKNAAAAEYDDEDEDEDEDEDDMSTPVKAKTMGKIALSSDAGVDLAGKLDRIYRALLSEYPSAADEHGRGLDSTIIHYAARLSAEYHPVNLEM